MRVAVSHIVHKVRRKNIRRMDSQHPSRRICVSSGHTRQCIACEKSAWLDCRNGVVFEFPKQGETWTENLVDTDNLLMQIEDVAARSGDLAEIIGRIHGAVRGVRSREL